MKSVKEQLIDQISGRCVRFNGLSNKECKEGVKYENVRDESVRPFRFPCLKRHEGGRCLSVKFPTPEEAEKEAAEIEEVQNRTVNALVLVKQNIKKTGELSGSIECPGCGGKLNYSSAKINGHVHASCSSCSMGWIE